MTIDALQQQVATLTAEVERLTNDRNLEKRWRKDSDERAEMLTGALEAAQDYLEAILAPCEPDCTCVLHIVEAALAVRGEQK